MRKRMLSALLALVVCAGVLGMLPLGAAAAAGQSLDIVGAGGGGAAGSAPGVYGPGGANGFGGTYNDTKGQDGELYLNGTLVFNNVYGGAVGGNPGTPVSFGLVDDTYGDVRVLAGYGGSQSDDPSWDGGKGGDAALSRTGSVTLASLFVRGGDSGNSSNVTDAPCRGGHASAVIFAGNLNVSGAITLVPGESKGGAGGSAELSVSGAVTADGIYMNGSQNRDSGSPYMSTGGTVSAREIVVGGGVDTAALALGRELVVPEGKNTTLTMQSSGQLIWPGAGSTTITVGGGGTLNIENNSGLDMEIPGIVVLGPGAVLEAGGTNKVTLASGTVMETYLSGTGTYDLAAGTGYEVWLNNNLASVQRVELAGWGPLQPGTDYTLNGRQLVISDKVMRQQPLGQPIDMLLLASNASGNTGHQVVVSDSRPTTFAMDFPPEVGFELSVDNGASWQALQSGVAMDIGGAAGNNFLVRQTAGFLTVRDRVASTWPSGLNEFSESPWQMKFESATSLHGPYSMTVATHAMTNVYGALTPEPDVDKNGSLFVNTAVPYGGQATLMGVLLDGTPLVQGTDCAWGGNSDNGNYLVQLYPALLNRLASGTHTLQAVFGAGNPWQMNYAEGSLAWKMPAPTPTPVPTATPAPQAAVPAAAAAPSPQTGDIGTGPYIVFAVSGGLMVVWLGMQVFKRRGKDD